MRTLGSDERKEAKRKRQAYWLSMFMLVILVSSTVGFAFLSYGGDSSSGETYAEDYAGDGGEYGAYDSDTTLAYEPGEVQAVPVSLVKGLTDYIGNPLYIVSDSRVAINEINIALGGQSIRIQEACLGECDLDLPERSCEEGNIDNVIVVKESELNNVYEENGCVFIEGKTKAVDAFLYSLFSS